MIYLVHVFQNIYRMPSVEDTIFAFNYYVNRYPGGNIWLEVISPKEESPK